MKTSEITVVLQGAVKPYRQRDVVPIAEVLQHTRAALPGARFVLSTWEGSDLPADLAVDEVVRSKDPGALAPLKLTDDKANNANRQIVSTRAGMRAVRTPYAVKLRTDCYLAHASFIDFYEAQKRRDGRDRRLVTSAFFTLDNDFLERIPYHVSDWLQFARTEVLQAYWDAPLVTPEAATFHEHRPHASGSNVFERRFRAQFAVEQHIAMHYAQRLGFRPPAFLNDTSPQVRGDYRRFLAEEVLVLDPWQSGLVFPKYGWVNESFYQGINNVMHLDWLALAGQASLEGEPADVVQGAIARRQRLKAVARWLFSATRAFHDPIFEESARGRFLRRQLMRSFQMVRALTRA